MVGAVAEIDLGLGMDEGAFLALTSNDEVNALACARMTESFGRSGVYQLVTDQEAARREALDAGGRRLFGEAVTFKLIEQRVREGWIFKTTPLSEEFTLDDYREMYGENAIPLFVVEDDGDVRVVTATLATRPRHDERLVALVRAEGRDSGGE